MEGSNGKLKKGSSSKKKKSETESSSSPVGNSAAAAGSSSSLSANSFTSSSSAAAAAAATISPEDTRTPLLQQHQQQQQGQSSPRSTQSSPRTSPRGDKATTPVKDLELAAAAAAAVTGSDEKISIAGFSKDLVLVVIPSIVKLVMFALWACVVFLGGCVRGSEAREEAVQQIKDRWQMMTDDFGGSMTAIFWKILLTLWCLAVILAVLSLLGFHPSRWMPGNGSGLIPHGEGKDVLPEIPEIPGEEDEEQLSMVASTTERKKLTKKEEIAFACDEVDCNQKCQGKASPKCAVSQGCMRERAKICKKRCRRARCENRCKEEPQLGYVEREMKLEKCKESCQTPKCKTKCEDELKPCKLKCRERANKYMCDKVQTNLVQVDDEPDGDLDDTTTSTGSSSSSSSGDDDTLSLSDADDPL